MRTRRPQRRAQERGAAAVELAIVLPLLLLLVFGVIDFGRLLFTQISIGSASREAARAASLGLTTQQAQAAALAASPGAAGIAAMSNTTPLSITLSTPACSAATLGDTATATVQASFRWITPIGLIRVFDSSANRPSTQNLTSRAVMRCEL
jgi:Flp pilus assembly protein TadG